MKYPPGFTPNEGSEEIGMFAEESRSVNIVNLSDHKAEEANKDGHGNCGNKNSKEVVSSSVCSGHFKKSGVPRTGGSILNLMDELVKVGNKYYGLHMDGNELESEVSNVEIKRAVWDCGTDKSPGPDGFTFGFYRRFWKIIENDVYDVVIFLTVCHRWDAKLIRSLVLEIFFVEENLGGGVEQINSTELSALDSLPTRFNVSRRGIDIDSIMCAICDNGVETSRHLFFSCCMVRQIVRKITRWWDVPYVEIDSYEDWYNWFVNLRIPSKHKQMFEGIDVMRRLVGTIGLKTRILSLCNC
ncbi:RNA-directed DNA polymerase, eukaryota [Tanacetum coccineum]